MEFKKTITNNYSNKIVEIVTSIGGFTGIFIAVFWITGRFYALGYFESLNIPLYLVTFSIWEYAEVSWYIWIGIIFGTTIAACVMLIILNYIFHIAHPIIAKILSILDKIFNKSDGKYIYNYSPLFKFALKIIRYCFLGLSCLCLIISILVLTYHVGKLSGRNYVAEANIQVEFISKHYLDISSPSIMSSSITIEPSYLYKGFKLLTYNEGRYFLFKDIDSVSLKPCAVYMVENTNVLQIKLTSLHQ